MRRRPGSFSRFVDENLVTAGLALVGENLARDHGGDIGDDHVLDMVSSSATVELEHG